MGAATRPFRFGAVTTSGTEASRRRWTEYVRRLEGGGFSTLLVADHYHNAIACTPRLAAAAAVTTTLRLGSYVYANDFRHPVLVARESAEIDRLSDGRMELGVGAGWAKDEYDMVGIKFDDGPTRVRRFEEAIGIIRALHRDGAVSHHGAFYQVSDCELLVEPVQRPIPLLIGGGGPRMTRFAAAAADTIAFVPKSLPGGGLDPAEFAADAFDAKIRLLDEVTAGAPDGGPERAVLVFYRVGTVAELPTGPDEWTTAETLVGSPYLLVGDTEQSVEALLERRERWGISYVTCWEEDVALFLPVVERLAGR